MVLVSHSWSQCTTPSLTVPPLVLISLPHMPDSASAPHYPFPVRLRAPLLPIPFPVPHSLLPRIPDPESASVLHSPFPVRLTAALFPGPSPCPKFPSQPSPSPDSLERFCSPLPILNTLSPRPAGWGKFCPPPGFSQIAGKWRRAAPPYLAYLIPHQFRMGEKKIEVRPCQIRELFKVT